MLKLDPSDLEPEPDEPQPSPRVTSKDIQHLADALHASTAALVMPDKLIPPQPLTPGCLDAPCLDAFPDPNPSPPLPDPFTNPRFSPAAKLLARNGAWP